MLEKTREHRRNIIFSIVLCAVTLFGLYQYNRVRELTYMRNIEYNRVFAELTEYVDDLEISLLKGQVVSTPEQMAKFASALYSQASAAKANLALLPLGGHQLEKTSEFLSQVGEYATAVANKMYKGEKLNNEDLAAMKNLTKYADTLKSGLDKMLLGINEGNISFEEGKGYIPRFVTGKKVIMADELVVLEEEFHNYPSLIYDGPFSQHLSLRESIFTKGKAEITPSQAKKYAKKFMGNDSVTVTEIGGKLPSYSVTGNGAAVEYTRYGGILLMMTKDRAVDGEKISLEEAKNRAAAFIKENGFRDMRESYYEKQDGSMVINYAYEQDNYIVFPDLVKVKIALDNGEVIGFESRGYIMNHTYRKIPDVIISREEALKNVSPSLNVQEIRTAIIPLENGSEAACYQIKGVVMDKHFLMYVNTQTGFTEDVQILIESENGTLAV